MRELESRINRAKTAANMEWKLFVFNTINYQREKGLLEHTFAEATLLRAKIRTVKAFESYRRIRLDRISNEEVFRRIREKLCFLKRVQRRKNTWIGHILKRQILSATILEEGQKTVPNCTTLPAEEPGCGSYVQLNSFIQVWERAASQSQRW